MKPYDDTLARLFALHPKLIDLSLDRMWPLLQRLGNPQQNLPPVIHVAGTNGKGSTTAFMRAILEAAGHRVHVYTSPHLVAFNERFRLGAPGGGRLVSDEELAAVLLECEECNAGAPITVFEITTIAGLVLFSRHPADFLLLEVGLGGKYDATNVIERPLVSVITSISHDHADFLGNDIKNIAAEKAGIIKKGVPVAIAPQSEAVLAVLEKIARDLRAPLRVAGEHWQVGEEHGRLVYHDDDGLLDLPPPRLQGRHQFANAGTAIAALRAAGLRLPVQAYETGMQKVEWPARMQRLSQGKLVALAPPGSELWLDGGHNADGGRAIAAAFADLEERVSRPLAVIVGMRTTKDSAGFLRNFAGLARRLFAVPIPQQQSGHLPEDIVAVAGQLGLFAQTSQDVAAALTEISQLSFETPPRILITGSLYLAGDVLAESGMAPQ